VIALVTKCVPALCAVAVLALLAFAGPSAARPFTPGQRAAMQQIVDEELAKQGAPGVLAGVWVPGGGRFVAAEGLSNRAAGTAMRRPDHFRIASITKTFIATAVLQLVDRGKVRLSDPISRFVDWPGGRRITVRQLLNQTSGIYNFVEDPVFERRFDADPTLPWTAPADGLDIARGRDPYFRPGKGFHYSETNYYLAGMIVEKVTGTPIERVLRRRILRPLGLRETSFPSTPALPAPFTRGYLEENGVLRDVTASNPKVSWTAGAMISTLDDLRVWARALATGRPLLKRRTQRARLPKVTIEKEPITVKYGLGMFSINDFLGHNGAIFGYSTTMLYLPKTGATIITFMNKASNESDESGEAAILLAKLLYPKRFPGLP
jgi:D-alanyl-D-alanine carboxypeptidase